MAKYSTLKENLRFDREVIQSENAFGLVGWVDDGGKVEVDKKSRNRNPSLSSRIHLNCCSRVTVGVRKEGVLVEVSVENSVSGARGREGALEACLVSKYSRLVSPSMPPCVHALQCTV